MKAVLRWLAKILSTVVTVSLLIVLFPFLSRIAEQLMPDESAAAIKTSMILATKLEDSARLETLKVEEEGILNYEVKAAFIGKVAAINVSYLYEGSFGVDLQKVQMHVNRNTITFVLPEPELIQDCLTPLDIISDNYWYPGFRQEDYERLLETERIACRERYWGGENLEMLWNKSEAAFEATITTWMKDLNRNLEIKYERVQSNLD